MVLIVRGAFRGSMLFDFNRWLKLATVEHGFIFKIFPDSSLKQVHLGNR